MGECESPIYYRLMGLESDIQMVKGVGPKQAMLFKRLGVITIADLLQYYPRRYDDYSNVLPISQIKPGQITIRARIKHVVGKYVRGGLHITEAVASDDSGSIRLVWFNQPYRANSIVMGQDYYLSGLFELRYQRLSLTNPNIEAESTFMVNTARIVPVYRETKGLKSTQIRKVLKTVISSKLNLPELLPEYIISDQKLMPRTEAIYNKHFPESKQKLARADERLGFEELFELIVAAQYSKQGLAKEPGIRIDFEQALAKQFTESLPFVLTGSQKQIIWQIYQDIGSGNVMNRLVEGDVGSGKTVVAAMSALMVLNANYQAAIMAPTELLAEQHYKTIKQLLEPLKMSSVAVLLTGGMSAKAKTKALASIKNKNPKIIVGTHALIQKSVDIPNLGLVVVDEQHRFGVNQRKKLLSSTGQLPHMLSLTATPIPRSLALTVFGEVDISILAEKPKNRKPIITELVKPADREKLYQEITAKLRSKQQVFVVCPLIEPSDALKARSAEATHRELSRYYSKFNVGLLHGKLKAVDKQSIMDNFVKGRIDILVSTTVIEVGVDVPNATIMLIEAPERFGLAQLHQLRGRIGRGDTQGYCYLMLSDANAASKRLRAIESTNDGFKLAELDLEIRGAGALYGTTQHGQLDLNVADFSDSKLIARARAAALEFLKKPDNLLQYPYIKQRIIDLQSIIHLN